MKLTKKECEIAVNSISNFINENCDSDDVCTMHDLKNKLNTIDELINEYFDNPPLKLKELHEGMWVWDDEQKKYGKVTPRKMWKHGLLSTPGLCWGLFKEGRYYASEVKE